MGGGNGDEYRSPMHCGQLTVETISEANDLATLAKLGI